MIRRLGLASVCAAALLVPAQSGAAQPGTVQPGTVHSGAVHCVQSTVPVALTEGGERVPVRGELCGRPDGLRDGAPVQLLLHGALYNHSYWDFGRGYSYARAMAARGIATFSFDAPGTFPDPDGRRPPPSESVTLQASAYVAHQLALGLKGEPGGVRPPGAPRFGSVIDVGHSFGSVTAMRHAVDYPSDVDGVLVTGMAHHLSEFVQTTPTTHPANEDQRFAGRGLDDGYLTGIPGMREIYYHPDTADPEVIAEDEAGKDVISETTTLGASEFLFGTPEETRAIRVPVLIMIGSRDRSICDDEFDCSSGPAIVASEGGYFSPQARLRGCAVPETGHNLTLHRDHAVSENAALHWSRWVLGGAHGEPPLPGCR